MHGLKHLVPGLLMGQVKSCRVHQDAEDWFKYELFIASKTPITVCGRRKWSPAQPDYQHWLSKSAPE
jgi:hypothetical protein